MLQALINEVYANIQAKQEDYLSFFINNVTKP